MISSNERHYGDAQEPIAIVGMASRFPGEASSVENFWDMISESRTGHSKVPSDRFDVEAWYHPNHERRGAVQPRSGFFLDEHPSLFDAPFFSITAKEAAGMDPMQRKLLEVAYEAFENAGIPMESLPRTQTGVYTGVMTYDYELLTVGDPLNLPQNAASGTSRAMLSNRISWFFDLRGPSFSLDTACSSSLYALHLACQSLRLGESTQALVTGTNLILAPNFISQLSSMHMLSPDGVSHSFDSRANGYARGEAIGAVVVKTLQKALEDGDTIRAVIRGSGVNQDGHTPGITMPSGEAQAALIRSTYATAGLSMDDTDYFEAHGTGTSLGDPIELGAIGASFACDRSRERPLYVGSVKTNVGHTEGTAGIAGVIKTVLALERGLIPAVTGFEKLNPKLRLEDWNLALPLEPTTWPTNGLRRASVNSFGFGGANAHFILDDAYHYLRSHGLQGNHRTVFEDLRSPDSGISVSESGVESEDPTQLFLFSAFDRAGIQRLETSYIDFLLERALKNRTYVTHDDLAYTLACRRTHFDFRSYVVAPSLKELASKLKEGLPKANRVSRHDNIIFILTGQGAQWPAMGRELLQNTVFKNSIDRTQVSLDSLGCTWKVTDLLSDPADTRIDTPEFSQPVCTILQMALLDLLRHWGVKPKATVGHSSGEVAAAYGAGLIGFEDAVRISYWRGLYSEEVKRRIRERRGAMMAANLSETEALDYLKKVADETAVVACVNSPSSVTISGDLETINKLEEDLKRDGKFARKLRVQVAYHSPHMKVVADDFLKAVGTVKTKQSDILMFSSVTEHVVEDSSMLDASYWMTNLISPVRFSGAVTNLLNHSQNKAKGRRRTAVQWSAMVEIGPHEALKGPTRQIVTAWDNKLSESIPYVSMLIRGRNSVATAKTAAGLLWASGHSVNVPKVNGFEKTANLVVLPELPPYAWNHNKGFWHEPPASKSARLRAQPRTDLLGVPVPNQNPMEPCWRNFLRIPECPWQEDHVITGTVLYPAAGMLIMAIEAALQIALPEKRLLGIELHEVKFDKGLVIPSSDEGVETSLSVKPHPTLKDWYSYTVFSLPHGGDWTKHSWGQFAILYQDFESDDEVPSGYAMEWQEQKRVFQEIKGRALKHIDVSSFYHQLQEIGTEYGPSFRNVIEAAAVPGEHVGVAKVAIPDTKSTMPHEYEYPHLIHPATLDAIFHLIFVAMGEGDPLKESAIPTTLNRMFVSAEQPCGVGSTYSGFARAVSVSARDTSGDIFVSDEEWATPKVIIKGMTVTEVSSGASASDELKYASVAANKKRIARLAWKEDVDSLGDVTAGAEAVLARRAQLFKTPNLSDVAAHLASWLDLACFKHANLNVLFIGTSNWSDSVELLARFAPKESQRFRFKRCSILENSEGEIVQLEHRLTEERLEIQYTALDIAQATDEQVQGLGLYDLVIVAISEPTLPSRLAALLSPAGKLAVLGFDNQDTANWKDAVLRGGFDQVVATFTDQHSTLVIASSNIKVVPELDTSEIFLLHHQNHDRTLTTLEERLSTRFTALGFTTRTIDLSEVDHLAGKAVVSLLEVEKPFVISWNADEFEQFRKLTAAKYLLWITHGGILAAGESSLGFAPTTGLLRTVRVEKPQIVLPHLDLSPSTNIDSEDTAALVMAAFRSSAKARISGLNNEMEFAESNGVLSIPRAVADDSFDYEMALHSANVRSAQGCLHSDEASYKLEAVKSGDLTSLRWIKDDAFSLSLADGEVEILTSYVALGMSDIRNFTNNAGPATFGSELTGTVVRTGRNVHGLLPGDRVLTLHKAPFKRHIRQDQCAVYRIPNSMPLEVAASLPLTFAGAWHALVSVARLQKDETVFIDGASSDMGQALVQLTQALDGKLFVSVNSKEQKEMMVAKYAIRPESVFYSRDMSISAILLSLTGGKGIDVIVTTSSGVAMRNLSVCLAEFGRLIDISKENHPASLATSFFKRNINLSSLNFDLLPDSTRHQLVQEIYGLMHSGSIRGVHPIKTCSVSNLAEVVSSVQTGNITGKVVIEFNEDAKVPILPSPPPKLTLDPEGVYVLAGGLGALGLTIAENMCIHGARHLVFLSRSGAKTTNQQQALQSLRDRGCAASAIKCDVTHAAEVEQFIHLANENSWKIKGVIQLAMVLRDSIFENMTYDKWRTAVDPKIKGTWNLHSILPQDLDFFIVMSSLSGIIGNTAQANYGAGNTYEDALAHYRAKQGLAATTLNVGLVTDASHFNEDSTIEDYLKKYSHWIPAQLTDRELQIALVATMRGMLVHGDPVPVQLLVGITDNISRGSEGLNLWPMDRKFDHRITHDVDSSADSKDTNSDRMGAAQTARDAVLVVEEALKLNVATAMTALPSDIDVEKPLYAFGSKS